MNIASLLLGASERAPRAVAVVDGGPPASGKSARGPSASGTSSSSSSTTSYADTARRSASLALRLAELGVERGDRVALSAVNSRAFLEATFAVAALGAILVPVNTRLAPAEQEVALAHAEPVLWIADARFEDAVVSVASRLASLSRIVWIGSVSRPGLAIPVSDYESLAASARATLEPATVAPEEPAQLYYTSGTTGRPKGVVLTHGNLYSHAEAAASELELASDDVWGHVAPMFHLADAWATLAVTLVGGRHVMVPRFEPREVLARMQSGGVTITNLVPTMLQRLLAEAPECRFDASALRMLLSGGAPIAPDVVRRVLSVFGCEYAQTYGMTETSPFLTLSLLRQHHWSLSAEEQLRVRARTGRPFETVELEVVDQGGGPVPADDASVGEIRVRGTTVSPGYWHDAEATAEAFRDGWLYTGDLAVVDGEGYVNIVDRKKDVIVTGGENVYSREVEDALHAHPAVLEAAAYGVPDPEWGEVVRVAVVLVPGGSASADELLATCRERLAGYKCPKRIELLPELPKTGSGKILKRALREE